MAEAAADKKTGGGGWLAGAFDFAKGLTNAPPNLLIAAGLLFILFGIAGGITYDKIAPLEDTYYRITAMIFGSLFLIAGIYLWQEARQREENREIAKATATQPIKAEDYNIQILSPGIVIKERYVDVSGTFTKHPPDGYELWIMRAYGDQRWVPVKRVEPENFETKGWSVSKCDLGGPQGQASSYGAYLLSPAAQAMIEYWKESGSRFEDIIKEIQPSPTNLDALAKINKRWLPALHGNAIKQLGIVTCHKLPMTLTYLIQPAL